jgi:hypothetical protein
MGDAYIALTPPRLILSGLLFYSSFSRFTAGAYTPTYYAFQSVRHSGDDVPIASCDALLSVLLLYNPTRVWAAALATAFFTVPITEGLKTRGPEGVVVDGLLFYLGAIVLGIEILRRQRKIWMVEEYIGEWWPGAESCCVWQNQFSVSCDFLWLGRWLESTRRTWMVESLVSNLQNGVPRHHGQQWEKISGVPYEVSP